MTGCGQANPRQSIFFITPFPYKFFYARQAINLDEFLKPENTFTRNPSVTGGAEQILLWPGGSGGSRRKHRPG
jgi:hypothetical protein